MALTGLEVQLDILRQDAVEQGSDELGIDVAARNLEAERVDTLVQDVEGLLVGLGSILNDDVLTDKPQVVVLLVTTDEGELARK